MRELRVRVDPGTDGGRQRAADLTWDLKEELRGADVESVRHVRAAAPGGAKGSAVEWAELAIGFAGALPGIVTVVQAWLGRKRGVSEITLELDGDKITLRSADPVEQRRLVDAFLARHPAT
jgi:hypothetical protein